MSDLLPALGDADRDLHEVVVEAQTEAAPDLRDVELDPDEYRDEQW